MANQQTRAIELLEDKIVECKEAGLSSDFIEGLERILDLVSESFDIDTLKACENSAVEDYSQAETEADEEFYMGTLRGIDISLVHAK